MLNYIYHNNPITRAVVIGGLEPMLQYEEILEFVKQFRQYSDDDIVIYIQVIILKKARLSHEPF